MNRFHGDQQMQDYIEGMLEEMKPKEIAEYFEIPVKSVYELARKLKRLAPELFGVQNFAELERRLLNGELK